MKLPSLAARRTRARSPYLVLRWTLALVLTCLGANQAAAQYHNFNVAPGSELTLQDYRSPGRAASIYDAVHADDVTSSDNGQSYFYGGMTHEVEAGASSVFFSFWPPRARVVWPADAVQKVVYAGPNANWHIDIGEGALGGITSRWPLFRTDLFSRIAVRFWQDPSLTHTGFQGFWMRDPTTGKWQHLGTVRYPFAVTGTAGMNGWQERFGAVTGSVIVDHARAYYRKSNVWGSASGISYTGGNPTDHRSFASLIDGNTATRSEVFGPNHNYPLTFTLTQAATPTLDALTIGGASARSYAAQRQLLVQWAMPETSTPQLGYKIEVFSNAAYTSLVKSLTQNDPQARQRLVTLDSGLTLAYVRLTVTDIFGRSTALQFASSAATAAAAATSTNLAPGLEYQYYEASAGTQWSALPSFAALTPVQRGAVNRLEVGARKRRDNYAFRFNGYFQAPSDGLYAFVLRSGDGSKLSIDGSVVIDADGRHNSTDAKSGWVALRAGPHPIAVDYYQGPQVHAMSSERTAQLHDGIGLYYEGPGIASAEVPASALRRAAASGEPTVTMTGNALANASAPNFGASVVANGQVVNKVQFFLTASSPFFYRPSGAVDYLLTEDTSAPYQANDTIWSAWSEVRARVFYANGTRTVDSAPLPFISNSAASVSPYTFSPLEVHNYPTGAIGKNGTYTLIGDGFDFLQRAANGDCTLIARLASITPDLPSSDGVRPGQRWRGGIVLRGSAFGTFGEPLGSEGQSARFAALFGTVAGETHFQDDTMREGNGDANRWSAPLGGENKWLKLQRVGDTFTSFVSADGGKWLRVNSVTLPNFGATTYAGVFAHAVQSQNSNIHRASFDNVSLLAAGLSDASTVALSPALNSVVRAQSVTLAAHVAGTASTSFRWQRNGVDIPGASAETYTIPDLSAAQTGNYTVVVNGVTSAAVSVQMLEPAGSGTWNSAVSGAWNTSSLWRSGLIASGGDAIADFGTLNLADTLTVRFESPRTIGTLITGDLDGSNNLWWLYSDGQQVPVTLATSQGKPYLNARSVTWLSTVLAGNQGFVKTGAGALLLSAPNTYTGLVEVRSGTLEVASKASNVDNPYYVSAGATLKIGYDTGGGYAATRVVVEGNGSGATSGFYLEGGNRYNASGRIELRRAPTTLRQYGTGAAQLGTFDINVDGLLCSAEASGSQIDPNIEIISMGYGMSVAVEKGASHLTGDLTIQGALNAGGEGFIKRGEGSLLLKGVAGANNAALRLDAGIVHCGVDHCLGPNATVTAAADTVLALHGFTQTARTLNARAGSTIAFGATNLWVVDSATLAGSLELVINKNASPRASTLMTRNPLSYGGTLEVENQSATPLAEGDSFQLFSAPGYAGSFSALTLPTLATGLRWDTSRLYLDGTIVITR